MVMLAKSSLDEIEVKPIRTLLNDTEFRNKIGDDAFDAVVTCSDVVDLSSLVGRDKLGFLALLAASKGREDLLRSLHKGGHVPLAQDDLGRNVLDYAAFCGRLEVVKYLVEELQFESNQDKHGHSSFQYACVGGDLAMMDFFLKLRTSGAGQGAGVAQTDSRPSQLVSKLTGDLQRKNWITAEDFVKAILLSARKGKVKSVLRLLEDDSGQDALPQVRGGIGPNYNSLLHILGRRVGADDLRRLQECGLELDLTATNRNGVTAFEEISADELKKFLDSSISFDPDIANEKFCITESYKITNPFVIGEHGAHCNLDLVTLLGLGLSKSASHRNLIFHPVFTGICSIKWKHVQKYYYLFLIMFLTLAILISVFTVISVEEFYNNKSQIGSARILDSEIQSWQISLLCVLIILGLFEICSMLFHNIWLNITRYLIWITCIVLGIILLNFPAEIIQETSFFILIIPWFICLKHIGHHHELSQYYSNFIEICKTCLKILCVFGSLLIAFILIFHVMMKREKLENEKEQSVFEYLHSTSMKTITMMIGDLTIDDFSNNYNNIQWSITFLSFTLIIAFILYNMMNALAVNDTEKLCQQADTFKIISLTKQILFFQNITYYLSKFCNLSLNLPVIKDFTVNCDNYEWKIERYSCTARSDEVVYRVPDVEGAHEDNVDMTSSKVQSVSRTCSLSLDFKTVEKIREIAEQFEC